MCLRMIAPFLPSTRAWPALRLARLLVNSITKFLPGDLAHASQDQPLRHRIHCVDVIHPFDSVPISLMRCVDAQKAGPSPRIRRGLQFRHEISYAAGLHLVFENCKDHADSLFLQRIEHLVEGCLVCYNSLQGTRKFEEYGAFRSFHNRTE